MFFHMLGIVFPTHVHIFSEGLVYHQRYIRRAEESLSNVAWAMAQWSTKEERLLNKMVETWLELASGGKY